MDVQTIRNVAIIAHVDHGKTTLLDELLRQSGQFGRGELQGDCILDSNPLERERGITILAKNCALDYTDPRGKQYHINLVDTPGHADFSGEVQRVLKMADGVLLLVDAFEGVMPQTRYVLSEALAAGLRPVVVVNKMDRPQRREHKVVDEVFDLLVELGAEDHALDFPVVYASGRQGWAVTDPEQAPAEGEGDIRAVFEAIIDHVPAPQAKPDEPLQMLITTLDYSEYVGRIGIGRVFAGQIGPGQAVTVIDRHGRHRDGRVGQVLRFHGLGRAEAEVVSAGDLCAVVGLEEVDIGDTLADPEAPEALPSLRVDEPTLHMTFRINDGPFAGREGKYVTSRQLRERLMRELQSNVALRVEPRGDEFIVSGRGMLHLGILLENMRREGYELCVGKPEVIFRRDEEGHVTEPIERLVVDVPNEYVGAAMQTLGDRRAEMIHMDSGGLRTKLEFLVPARGLIGLRNRLLTASAGEAIMHHRFDHYGPQRGELPGRSNGVMIATETGQVTAYAVDSLADRGVMFVSPGQEVYEGQVVGEHAKDNDITVNAVRQKKLTNIRSSTKEATVTLKTARAITLEGALEYIEQDELVELTPASVRIRKRHLTENQRKRSARQTAGSAG